MLVAAAAVARGVSHHEIRAALSAGEQRCEPSLRDKAEIRLMLEAGVSIADAAAYFRVSEAAVRQLVGGRL